MPKVCLDPGHGGSDPGAVGNGLLEKVLTLAICLMLKAMLEYNGIHVFLTRDGDYSPGHLGGNINGELKARVAIAEKNKVDLFVSVHINAGGGTGQEILVSGMGGRAETAARKVLPYLVGVGGWQNRGVKAQNVLVLRETSMPAILTESGFIDSASDSAKLKYPLFIHGLAVAHAKGICAYFGITYQDSDSKTLEAVKGVVDVLDVAVLLFTKEDYWAGADVAAQNGNCAVFVRPAGVNTKKLIVVGGATTGHANEVLLSGNTKYDTAAEVAKYLG